MSGTLDRMTLWTAYGLWMSFIVSWWLAVRWAAPAAVSAPTRTSALYYAGFAVAFLLLFVRVRVQSPLWRNPPALAWALILLEGGAFAFAWWARVHLGRLWSGMLTLREGHKVVDTGPYRLVRHPIYTGFIGASWALALVVATPTCLAGALAMTAVMSVKSRTEEALLRQELGAGAYDAYAARTPMLIPFMPR